MDISNMTKRQKYLGVPFAVICVTLFSPFIVLGFIWEYADGYFNFGRKLCEDGVNKMFNWMSKNG